ncbi:hypothetical protein QBC46DRAFT_275519 [Diplogelasinospora grovesii]|uniref:Protein kinase domain-containing protein n=1 Tax=Diplogelasinospora grovesii TaxID=303347 RepID=A0AAN6MUI0_9PEZI|nr:hypothetical protein QBC46DRAFT_275519 [Diplogelasinospora grovesii]
MQTFHLDSFAWSEEGFDHEDIDIYIRSFGAAFLIQYRGHLLVGFDHVYAQFLDSLDTLRGDDDDKSRKEVERLKKPFETLMTSLAPHPPISTSYLYDYLYPQWFILNATVKDATTLQPQCQEKFSRHEINFPGEYHMLPHRRQDLRTPLASFASYSSRQVQLLPSTSQLHPCLRGPAKVLVGHTTCYFKAWKPGRGKRGATYNEILAYGKIANAIAEGKIQHDIHICRLHGIVVDNDDDLPQHYPPDERGAREGQDRDGHNKRLVGILLTYVENKGTLKALAPWSDCAQELRPRWAEKLEVLIQTLHCAGLVWGDAKPDNVLVDTRDDLWLVDFGGSFTEGWVDKEKRDTQEGDLQGLERIKDWLVKCAKNPVHKIVRARRE